MFSLSTILGLAGTLLKALGLVEWGEAMVKQAQDRQLGRQLQSGADAQATVAADIKANAAADKVNASSDATVTSDLERFSRK